MRLQWKVKKAKLWILIEDLLENREVYKILKKRQKVMLQIWGGDSQERRVDLVETLLE